MLDYEKIINTFTDVTGYDLASIIPDNGSNEVNRVNRFIDLQAQILTFYIRRYNYTFKLEKCKEAQNSTLYEILARQMLYACENGTPETVSGVDVNSNTIISSDKILLAHISPLAMAELEANGFLYRAIS